MKISTFIGGNSGVMIIDAGRVDLETIKTILSAFYPDAKQREKDVDNAPTIEYNKNTP